MVVRRIAKGSETEGIAALIAAGKYPKALDQAVTQLGAELGQYCMAVLGEQSLAEDAAIQALADFYAAMPALSNPRPRPFLFTAARRACMKAQTATDAHAASAALEGVPRANPTDTSIQAARTRALLAAMKPEERDAALLRYLGRLGYADIAIICGVDEETARKLVGKALLRLRAVGSEEQDDPAAEQWSGDRK